jgi:hypothetical protein
MRDFVSTNVRLPTALHRALKHRAVAEGRSLADVIRESVELYLVGEAKVPADDADDWGDDPLERLWSDPVEADVEDGAVMHDRYIYDSGSDERA